MGEEILWRGVILPRQEVSFGKYAWIIHGFGWGLFHIAFGWQLLVTLDSYSYLFFLLLFKKERTAGLVYLSMPGLNGPSFIAISLGFL